MWNRRHTVWRWRRYGAILARYRLLLLFACCAAVGLAAAFKPSLEPALSLNIGPKAARYGYPDAPRNCTHARAMGLRNIPVGSRYYAPWLDGDGDGLACEPWHGGR